MDESTGCSILAVIKARRSTHKMKPERPPRESIERMLEAATYAPNHRKVEPWRFFVVAGPGREKLGHCMAEAMHAQMVEPGSAQSTALLARERHKPLRAPVVIVVASLEPEQANVPDIENVEAVSAAVQNMLLVAEAEGLATIWRSGHTVYDPMVKRFFDLQPHEHIIGMIYVGYLDGSKPEHVPTPYQQKTEWFGWEEE